jgi:penicillin-binding protein 1A
MDDLVRYRPDSTTVLYDVHGKVFGSFALERRVPVRYEDFSPLLRQAVISIEDKKFEKHWGVNLIRVLEAAYRDLTSGERAQGASTLTMQLAKNLFLSSERSFGRKVQEVFLAIQIEHTFTKEQIFQIYGNQIYLGHGAYGFEAGAETYFSRHAKDLTLAEAALLAGLPKAPSSYSPIGNPDRAFRRRNMVINAMLEDGAITAEQANAAKSAPLGLRLQAPVNGVAPYYVEEVRQRLEKRYGAEQVHQAGLRVYTTLDLDLQLTANKAVLDNLAAYERRHGWHGHLLNVINGGGTIEGFRHPDWNMPASPGAYIHGVVTSVWPNEVIVQLGPLQVILNAENWAWTQEKAADTFLRTGDIVYLRITATEPALKATLEQDSGAQGALLAMDNATGDVLSLVGGRDFNLSQFDRATQAERQTGSSFKPYVYTAAVEAGAKPEDMILDSPASFPTLSGVYSPHNYDEKYLGSITLLHAFADSRNIPALRLAERVGIRKVIDVAHRFGLSENIPAFLPIALGSADITLSEQVAAYSSFPNDGVRIAPRYVRRVTDADGVVLAEETSEVSEATSVKTARTMMIFLQEVVRAGTGAAARSLNHPLGGKTGTTNDFTDAWFVGFTPSVTCGVWVGYDDRKSLGEKETGAHAALPAWMEYMRGVIATSPQESFAGVKQQQKAARVDVVSAPKLARNRSAVVSASANSEEPRQ